MRRIEFNGFPANKTWFYIIEKGHNSDPTRTNKPSILTPRTATGHCYTSVLAGHEYPFVSNS